MTNPSKINCSFFHALILISVSFLAFNEVFRMYFFRDDFSILYNLEQNLPHQYPYMHEIQLYLPIYNLFHLNPAGYFIYGFVFFLISILTFYLLVYELLSKKVFAFIASLIYATSPVGISSVVEMSTYQTSYFILSFLFLILILLIKFYKTLKIKFYIASIFILIISFEIEPFRSFLFPIIMIILGFIYNARNYKSKAFLLQLVIIVGIWLSFFMIRPHLSSQLPLRGSNEAIGVYFNSLKIVNIVVYPVITFLNVVFLIPSGKILPWIRIPLTLLTLFVCLIIFTKLYKKHSNALKNYIFSCLFIYIVALAFFILGGGYIFGSDDRYMTFALPGHALLIASLYMCFSIILKKRKTISKIPYLILFYIVINNIFTTRNYLSDFNKRRIYVDSFFSQIKKYMPNLPSGSLIYFKLPTNDPDVHFHLYDSVAVGFYDSRAVFAVMYHKKIDELNPVIMDYSSLVDFVKKTPASLQKTIAFNYDGNNLQDITKETQLSLLRDLSNK